MSDQQLDAEVQRASRAQSDALENVVRSGAACATEMDRDGGCHRTRLVPLRHKLMDAISDYNQARAEYVALSEVQHLRWRIEPERQSERSGPTGSLYTRQGWMTSIVALVCERLLSL